MKPTDFSFYISRYITKYLPDERGASSNTIKAYSNTFVLFLKFIENKKNIKVEKLTLNKIKKETILDFLEWLQKDRKCSVSTRNTRLATIHSFYRYLQYENIEHLHECQRILSIKVKKSRKENINYLSVEGVKILLEQPDASKKKGRRDLALLSLMYDTGARVQEIIDLTPSMLNLNKPATIRILGKGNKVRLVPMLDAQVEHLKNYIMENRLNEPFANMYPLFSNSRNEKLTRAGISYILKKYADKARNENKMLIPDKISPHCIRHTKAMHLLQAGVNLVYIRDILGHVSVQTTEVYARADSKQKREALEKAYVEINPDDKPVWSENVNLLSWLKSF